jgi:flavin reductase (DIM6/NTAB) family NADH-FMN oxidoreductase RutF
MMPDRIHIEFVVSIISEPFLEAANYTSIDAPSEVSEWDLTGLTPAPSVTVTPPGVAESAFRMECVLGETFFGTSRQGSSF